MMIADEDKEGDKEELVDKPSTPPEDDKEKNVGLSYMSPLEVDKKKRRKRNQILTPNKLLTRLPVLLAKIKAGNIWSKLKNEVRQILYLLY